MMRHPLMRWSVVALVVGPLAVPCSAVARVEDEARLEEVERLLNQGDVSCASVKGCASAIELYNAAFVRLEKAGRSVDLSSLQEEGSDRFEALTFYLVRNSIIANFQAGLYLARGAAEKMKQLGQRMVVLQEHGQDGSGDALTQALTMNMTHDAREAIPYLERAAASITEVPTRFPWMKQPLDATLRFTDAWGGAGQMSQDGTVGFSDYYLGGAYVNLVWLSAILGDRQAQSRWFGKLRDIGQQDQLDRWKRGLSLEVQQVLNGHQL